MKKITFITLIIFIFTVIFVGCDNSTEPDDKEEETSSGISSSSFAFKIGNEWNYSGKGLNTTNNQIPKSIGTARLKVLGQTNSNGLNGNKMYSESTDYKGHYMGYAEFFISTENDGLWTLEELPNGSTSPLKILPFNTNSAVIRSEIINDQIPIYIYNEPTWYIHHYENIQLNIDIKFQYIGKENISTTAGNFNNCHKIKIMLDVSQKSDTNGVIIFNGKTWYDETIWWLSDNNGLIKTETLFNTIIDSVKTYIGWDPNTGPIYVYKDIISLDFRASNLKRINAEDLMLVVSDRWYGVKLRGNNSLKYLGKYITELNSKNF